MYIYIYMYIYVYIHTYIHTYMHACMHVCIYVRTFVHTNIASHHIAWHHMTWHDITLHDMTLHTNINAYPYPRYRHLHFPSRSRCQVAAVCNQVLGYLNWQGLSEVSGEIREDEKRWKNGWKIRKSGSNWSAWVMPNEMPFFFSWKKMKKMVSPTKNIFWNNFLLGGSICRQMGVWSSWQGLGMEGSWRSSWTLRGSNGRTVKSVETVREGDNRKHPDDSRNGVPFGNPT